MKKNNQHSWFISLSIGLQRAGFVGKNDLYEGKSKKLQYTLTRASEPSLRFHLFPFRTEIALQGRSRTNFSHDRSQTRDQLSII